MRAAYPFSAVVGQDELKLALLLSAVDPAIGGVLIKGERGTAKTTIARGLAALLPPKVDGVAAPFVELPLGATEDRVVGSLDVTKALREGHTQLRSGVLARANGGVLYVDEVNLLPDHLVDLLLDAAASGWVTVERDGVSAGEAARFVLVGTMNPEEGDLRPQFIDRFGLSVQVRGLDTQELRMAAVSRRLEFDADPAAVVSAAQAAEETLRQAIVEARARLPLLPVTGAHLSMVTAICSEQLLDGIRGDLAIIKTARALAAWEKANEIGADHVRQAASFALPHRIHRTPSQSALLRHTSSRPPSTVGRYGPDTGTARDRMEATPSADEGAFGEAGAGAGTDRSGTGAPGQSVGATGSGVSGAGSSFGAAWPGVRTVGSGLGAAGLGVSALGSDLDAAWPGVNAAGSGVVTGRSGVGAGGSGIGSVALDLGAGVSGVGAGDSGVAPGLSASAAPLALGQPTGINLVTDAIDLASAGRRGTGSAASRRAVRATPYDQTGTLAINETLTAAATRGARVGEGATALSPNDLMQHKRSGPGRSHVLFLVDASASMATQRRLDLAKSAALGLLKSNYRYRDEVALMVFRGESAQVLVPFTADTRNVEQALGNVPTGGRTPLAGALAKAAELLVARQPALLVLFTDGRANVSTSGGDPWQESLAACDTLKASCAGAVVVDCEPGPIVLGRARQLAARLGADCIALNTLQANDLTVKILRRVEVLQ